MRSRLVGHKLDEATVEAEVERLDQAGLLDDEAFAGEMASSLVKRGHGPRGVVARLRSKGIDEDLAQAAADHAIESAGGEQAVAMTVVERRYGDLSKADRKARSKAAQHLIRRGFSPGAAGNACGLIADYEL